MKASELVHWAETKNCGPRRTDGTCDHEACEVNVQAIALLNRLKEVSFADPASGQQVEGWLLTE